jgi:hypothetical protein
MALSRKKTTQYYKGWRIESSSFSHRGERLYEAGIFGAMGLADIAHGFDRLEAIQAAERKIDAHLTGRKLLHNLR